MPKAGEPPDKVLRTANSWEDRPLTSQVASIPTKVLYSPARNCISMIRLSRLSEAGTVSWSVWGNCKAICECGLSRGINGHSYVCMSAFGPTKHFGHFAFLHPKCRARIPALQSSWGHKISKQKLPPCLCDLLPMRITSIHNTRSTPLVRSSSYSKHILLLSRRYFGACVFAISKTPPENCASWSIFVAEDCPSRSMLVALAKDRC